MVTNAIKTVTPPSRGALLLPGAMPTHVCADQLAMINRHYAAEEFSPRDERRFSVHSSSLRLSCIPQADICGLLQLLCKGDSQTFFDHTLGQHIVCDTDQCWVRRQYAPANYPPLHAPHSWHQDGALGFDFLAHAGRPFPIDAMLHMVTCWIALTSCGVAAPGLELVTPAIPGLLPPVELSDQCVRQRFAAEQFWRPAMEPGDALLFCGGVLHRTHVTPAMTRDRTSMELRFFPADKLSARLAGDRFIPVN